MNSGYVDFLKRIAAHDSQQGRVAAEILKREYERDDHGRFASSGDNENGDANIKDLRSSQLVHAPSVPSKYLDSVKYSLKSFDGSNTKSLGVALGKKIEQILVDSGAPKSSKVGWYGSVQTARSDFTGRSMKTDWQIKPENTGFEVTDNRYTLRTGVEPVPPQDADKTKEQFVAVADALASKGYVCKVSPTTLSYSGGANIYPSYKLIISGQYKTRS